MTSGVPWQVEDIPQQAREAAREAARRSGMSVGEWLDSLISDRAAHAGTAAWADDDRHNRAGAVELAQVRGRLDEVGRQLDQLSRLNASQSYLRPDLLPAESSRELADVLWRLDRRIDQLIATGRAPNDAGERRLGTVDAPSLAADPSTPLERALMEIAQRQRTLDADSAPAAAPTARADVLPRAPTQGLSTLEDQLRQVTTQIETLRPCGVNVAVETLRDDLAEIGLMLKEAMPRQSIEALETQVRGLSERLAHSRPSDGTDVAIAGVERGLAEIRDALHALTPAENLVGVDQTVRELSRKIDLIAFNSQDPAAMEQLEGAIVGLRGIATQVASDGALAKLSEDVRDLAAKVDQIASSAELLSTLEHRISSMAEVLESRHQIGAPASGDLDAVVNALADRLEQRGLTHSDQAAVGQLEDRITTLVDKLDTSNEHLNHLETIEQALSDLLTHLEREPIERPPAAAPPEFMSLRQDVQQTQTSLESVQGAIEHLIDRLASIESDMRASPLPAAAVIASRPADVAATMPVAAPERAVSTAPAALPAAPVDRALERSPAPIAPIEHRPIDPSLPPDHPLEPGATRGRTGNSPGERIAASEAALGTAKPPAGSDPGSKDPGSKDPGSKSNFIAAARRAAQAANSEGAARTDKTAPTPASKAPQAKTTGGWGNRVRSLLVAASVVAIVLGSLHLVVSRINGSDESGETPPTQETQSLPKVDTPPAPPSDDGLTAPAAKTPAGLAPGRQSSALPGDSETSAPPAAAAPAVPVTADKDVTGSIPRMPIMPGTTPMPAFPMMPGVTDPASAAPHGAHATSPDRLPLSMSASLRAAAAKGDPGAEYEIGQRYAEGRGVPQNLSDAAEWYDRAAKQGLPPAQFRLGGFYEKGFGVKRDLDAARRLYLAAADAGNAKAMHNLAVLYAEGIDGKPDYQNAAKWFRKAAGYGLSDSQYNLGILYGRGIGMQPDLAEAYKWFALAARDGDKESANKRDDVGGRLDPKALAAAKLAVEAWTALEQPETATQAAAPAGGWDNFPAPPPASTKPRNPAPRPDRATPTAAR
jgi:localization factor PodJL